MGTDKGLQIRTAVFTVNYEPDQRELSRGSDRTQTGTLQFRKEDLRTQGQGQTFLSAPPTFASTVAWVGGKRLPLSYLLGFDFYLIMHLKGVAFATYSEKNQKQII